MIPGSADIHRRHRAPAGFAAHPGRHDAALSTPEGTILQPDVSPWYFHEEEVPSAGLHIRRIPAVARWIERPPFVWVSRRVSSGKGEGSSGLRFDIAVPPIIPTA